MKHLLITTVAATALLSGVNLPAHALQCSNFVQVSGYAGTNPPVSATVSADGGMWSVFYTLKSGMTVDRSTQFAMVKGSNSTRTEWSGRFFKNPDKWMHGEVQQRSADNHLIYIEDLYDRSNNHLAKSEIDCGFAPSPAPAYNPPPVVASTPTPTSSTIDKVPITFSKGGAYVAVSIGTMPATMLVDTGATGMTVSETIANWLVANGQATNGSTDHATLAGGVQKDFRGIDIGSVSVGGHVVRNVHAGVVPDGADMLLGLGVLAGVSPQFAINVATSTLDFQ